MSRKDEGENSREITSENGKLPHVGSCKLFEDFGFHFGRDETGGF